MKCIQCGADMKLIDCIEYLQEEDRYWTCTFCDVDCIETVVFGQCIDKAWYRKIKIAGNYSQNN